MTAFSKGAYYGYVNIGYLSFRIAGTDGVSLEAERWKIILERMGHKVTFIAGELDQSGVLIDSLHFTHPEIYKIHEDIITKNIDYKKAELKKDVAIILGNEVGGIEPEILKQCDVVAEIPMRGQKESLNVSVALGVVLYHTLDF